MASRYRRNVTVESAPMRNETVLFHPGNNKFCLLNPSAALLWSEIEQSRTVSELADSFQQHFDGVEAGQASRDIEAALAQLIAVDCVVQTQ